MVRGVRESGLTGLQERFCNEYLVDYCGLRAAKAAGYSEGGISSVATRILKLPLVQKYLKEKQAKMNKKLDISAERVLEEMARLAFSDVTNLLDEDGKMKPMKELNKDDTAALSALEMSVRSGEELPDGSFELVTTYKAKHWDKVSALEKLAKHLGMFEDAADKGLTVNIKIEGRDADCG